MSRDDRYHTTSWDGREVSRKADAASQNTGAQKESTRSTSSKKKTKRRKGMNPILAIVLWCVIVVTVSSGLAAAGWLLAQDFAALSNGEPMQKITVEITEDYVKEVRQEKQENGTVKDVTVYDISAVADMLKDKGLIKYPWFFRLFNKVYHGETKITQGTFELNTEMDYMSLIRSMRSRGGKAETVDITIPEGYNVRQVIDLLAEKGVSTKEKLTAAAENALFEEYAFVDNENLGNVSRLEGFLYPDTYNFYVGGDPKAALNTMLSTFNKKIYQNEDISTMLEGTPFSLEDVITVASLIEKETDGTDRDKIASVIYNRLANAGETAYFLQIDASLVYAAGREITQEDYAKLDSPYNLYTHTGLPPTPISNPGLASIRAALQPAKTNYYFYFLGEDGKHVFSETLRQHENARAGR